MNKPLNPQERAALVVAMLEEYEKELAVLTDAELLMHAASLGKHRKLPDDAQAHIGQEILKTIWK